MFQLKKFILSFSSVNINLSIIDSHHSIKKIDDNNLNRLREDINEIQPKIKEINFFLGFIKPEYYNWNYWNISKSKINLNQWSKEEINITGSSRIIDEKLFKYIKAMINSLRSNNGKIQDIKDKWNQILPLQGFNVGYQEENRKEEFSKSFEKIKIISQLSNLSDLKQ